VLLVDEHEYGCAGVSAAEADVVQAARQLAELTPSMLTRSSWERTHAAELHRISALDQQIDMTLATRAGGQPCARSRSRT